MSEQPELLLPFRDPWGELVLDGAKALEVRTRPLKIGARVWIYQSGGARQITGSFHVAGHHFVQAGLFPLAAELAAAHLTHDQYRDRLKSGAYFHQVARPRRLARPVTWWKSPPRSVWGLTPADVAEIEHLGQLPTET